MRSMFPRDEDRIEREIEQMGKVRRLQAEAEMAETKLFRNLLDQKSSRNYDGKAVMSATEKERMRVKALAELRRLEAEQNIYGRGHIK